VAFRIFTDEELDDFPVGTEPSAYTGCRHWDIQYSRIVYEYWTPLEGAPIARGTWQHIFPEPKTQLKLRRIHVYTGCPFVETTYFGNYRLNANAADRRGLGGPDPFDILEPMEEPIKWEATNA